MQLSVPTNGIATSSYTAIFRPLPWQIPAWRDKGLVMLLTGSAGGGKSRLAAEKIHGFCKKYAGAAAFIGRKAREWNRTSILPFYRQTVVGDDPAVRYLKSEGVFEYTNGSKVWSGGMKDDDQREAMRSIGGDGGLDIVWLEEASAFIRQDYEEVLGRLRHNAGGWRQIILSTNPGPPLHWINTDLIKGQQATVYYSGARDNPNNPAEYLDILGRMTGVMRDRLVLGKWVQAEGAVYDTFDRNIHVQERPDSEFKEWYLALDEGYTNPAVILLVGQDADGRLHVSREFYQRGVLQSAVVSAAKEWANEKRCGAVVDEAAAGLIADMNNSGVSAFGSKGRVLDGIQLVQDALKVAGDGRPRLTIDPSCYNLISEFESYVWKIDRSTKAVKDEPTKENDHALDALRYLVWHLSTGPTWYML